MNTLHGAATARAASANHSRSPTKTTTIMNTDTLPKLVQIAGEHAKAVLIGLGQPLMPSWVYIDGTNQLHVLATPWRSDQEKVQVGTQMRRILREAQAQAYSLVVEAWAARAPAGWKPDQKVPIRPSNRPDRQEIVVAFATDGERTEWRRWEIVRDWQESVTALNEQAFDGMAESWLTRLLKKHA